MKSENKQNASEAKDAFDINVQACSTMDCTGLIPALPETEEELEAYEELYPYLTHAKNKNP